MSNFLYKFSILIIGTIVSTTIPLYSQCGCSSSQQFLPPLHWLGSSEISISQKKRLHLDFMYKFATGNNLYKGTEIVPSQTDYKFHFIDFFSTYGLTNYTSIDFYLDYNFRLLNQYGFDTKGYGFSNASLGLRHTFYESENSDLVINGGSGIKIPLMKFKPIEEYPIISQPTNGSFGFYAFALLQKSIPNLSLNLLLYSRFDYNFKNNIDYKFAPSISSSLFLSRRFSTKFVALAELRHSFMFQDKYKDTTYPNSGANLIFLVPRLTFIFDEISISPYFELPIYQNYKGEQLGAKFAIGINFNYVYNFSRRKF